MRIADAIASIACSLMQHFPGLCLLLVIVFCLIPMGSAFDGGSASASSIASGSSALNAIDNDPSSVWQASSGAYPQGLIFDSGAGITHRATSYCIGRGASNLSAPAAITMQGSNDAETWIEMDARILSWVGSPLNQSVLSFSSGPIAEGDRYRFFRLLITSTEGGAAAAIGEWTLSEDLEVNITPLLLLSRPFGNRFEIIDSENMGIGVYDSGDRLNLNESRNYTIMIHPGLASESNNIQGFLERWLSWIKTNYIALTGIALILGAVVLALRRRH